MPRPGRAGLLNAMTCASGATFAPMPNVLPMSILMFVSIVVRSSHDFRPTKIAPALDFEPKDRMSKPLMPMTMSTPGSSCKEAIILSMLSCVTLLDVPGGRLTETT